MQVKPKDQAAGASRKRFAVDWAPEFPPHLALIGIETAEELQRIATSPTD